MGVYIEGMEMPMGGHILIVFPSGRVLEVSADATQDIFRETQAVPVLPHGRLIDADALKEAFCGNCFADEKPMECSEPCMDMRIILEAPTIISAEPKEEET